MCIIIYDRIGGLLTEAQFANLYSRNSDGFGIIPLGENQERRPAKIGNPKKFEDVGELWSRFREAPYIAHLRLRTHGLVDEENCHPYPIGDGNWLFHNGVIGSVHEDDKSKSDTWHFIEYVVKPLGSKFYECIRDPNFNKVFGKMLGANKLAVVTSDEVMLVNEQVGTWKHDNNLWLSNTIALDNPITKAKPPVPFQSGLGYGHYYRQANHKPNTTYTSNSNPPANKVFAGAYHGFKKDDITKMDIAEIVCALRWAPVLFSLACKTHFQMDVNIGMATDEIRVTALEIFKQVNSI